MKSKAMHPFSRFARYFLEVARLGSLRRAADVLHVSASAIDRQILLAEEEFRMPLFERLPSGMRLTAAGELLLADLRRWRKEHEQTLEHFDELQGLRRGHISIAVIDALSEGAVADAIARAGESYPEFTFDLRVLENRKVAEQVAKAEVDIGVLLDPEEHSGLSVQTVVSLPLGVVMPVKHPWATESRLSFSRLAGYRQVMPAVPLLVEERMRPLFAAHMPNERPAMVCNDIRMIRTLIRGGAGLGVLSLLDVASDVSSGNLAFVPLQGRAVVPLNLALCVAPLRQLSPAAKAVKLLLSKAIRELAKAGAAPAPI